MILCIVIMMSLNLIIIIFNGLNNICLLSLKYGRLLTTISYFKKLVKYFKIISPEIDQAYKPPLQEVVELFEIKIV